jgi:hypothetical protein
MGGPEMAPQTPQRSERPGGAVALLYLAYLASPHPARYARIRAVPPRRRGSSTSRNASPSMLKPKTGSEMAAPGQSAIHGAWYMNERPEPDSIAPHDG